MFVVGQYFSPAPRYVALAAQYDMDGFQDAINIAACPGGCHRQPPSGVYDTRLEYRNTLYSISATSPPNRVDGSCISLAVLTHLLRAPSFVHVDDLGFLQTTLALCFETCTFSDTSARSSPFASL
jgi:hypothetical protein